MTDHDNDSGATGARPRLPDVALPPLAGGDAVPLRVARHATVLVLLPDAPTDADAAYLRALAAHAQALHEWDARPFAVVARRDAPPPPIPALVDRDGVVAAAAGVAAPALVVADQWGEVHAARPARDGQWLAVEKLEQWVRWLSIRCAG